jgi:hypothetical protein
VPPIRKPIIEQTPGQEAMTSRLQRTLNNVHQDVSNITASDIPFEATAADWVSPAPTNLQDAISRLAASAGAHPVP